MPHTRLESIRSTLSFARADPEADSDDETDLRWGEVDEFISAFYDNLERFTPEHYVCVDESMIRWSGQGGDGHTKGIPHYVQMERKPDYGCELTDIADVQSLTVLGLKLKRRRVRWMVTLNLWTSRPVCSA